ncbi:MAG: DUF4132 domain-containing protein [Myxococcota bacterium]
MRRFERDGRFWEVLLDGAAVTTRSGTLAGKPRSNSERFASPKLALAEMDKRVAKRMSEGGWVEVLPPFQGTVDLADRVVGVDPDKAARWVRRPGALAVDPGAAAAVERGLALARDKLLAGLSDEEAHAAVVRRVLDHGPGAIGPSLDEHAVLLALAPEPECADLLVGRFGIGAAVAAVATGPRFTIERELTRATLREGDGKQLRVRPAVGRLRDLLLLAPDPDWASAETVARAALGGSRGRDLELVTLFPGTDWVDAWLVAAGLTADTLQVCGAASPAAFAALVQSRRPSRDTAPERLVPYLEVLLQRYGLGAAPAVEALAAGLGAEGISLRARLRTPQTVDALLALVDHPALGSPARAALIAMSDRTLATLAARGRLSGIGDELAQELARQPGLVPALLPHLAPRAAARVSAWLGDEPALPVTDDLPAVFAPGPGSPLAPWIRLPSLPTLRTPDGSQAYPASACVRALEQLSAGEEVEAVASEVGAACDPASFDALLAEVLRGWSEHGAPALYGTSPWKVRVEEELDDDGYEHRRSRWIRDRKAPESIDRPWILRAVQVGGAEACGKALRDCILDWGKRGARYPELLADALDVLRILPGEGVLVHLGELARRVPRARVRVETHLGQVARRRGADPRHVDELLLPTLGLDDRGRVGLDYGPRTFVGTFDPALEPVLLGVDGRPIRALPKPSASDDPTKARQAQSAWSALKKQVRSVRTTLLGRLEDGLRTQRTWTPDAFARHLARHPLARHPVSALVWTCGDARFRVDESGEPVDVQDQPVPLVGDLRLAHPVDLPDAERDAWKRVFVDYQLVQPFPQLDREQPGYAAIAAARGATIPRGRLFALRNRGWVWRFAGGEGGPALAAVALELQGVRVTVTAVDPCDVKADEGLVVGRVEVAGSWDAVPRVVLAEVARDLQRAIEASPVE